MTQRRITTEEEFLALMERVDASLRDEGVAIPARPLRACGVLAVQLGEFFELPYPRRDPQPGCYTGHDLTIRLHAWFEARYGKRLNIDFAFWRAVALICGDLWLVQLPTLIGTFRIVAGDSPMPTPGTMRLHVRKPGDPPSIVDCLNSVVDLPAALRASMSVEERWDFLLAFRDFAEAFQTLSELRSEQLVRQAGADVAEAVGHLMRQPSNPPLSKWASLQAAEKLLKMFIQRRGEQFQMTHKLSLLADHAERLGLPPLDRVLIEEIQCEPAVRYGTTPVSPVSAAIAHRRSLQVIAHIGRALGAQTICILPPAP